MKTFAGAPVKFAIEGASIITLVSLIQTFTKPIFIRHIMRDYTLIFN